MHYKSEMKIALQTKVWLLWNLQWLSINMILNLELCQNCQFKSILIDIDQKAVYSIQLLLIHGSTWILYTLINTLVPFQSVHFDRNTFFNWIAVFMNWMTWHNKLLERWWDASLKRKRNSTKTFRKARCISEVKAN